MEELRKYRAKGTVTFRFEDWTLATSERKAMEQIANEILRADIDDKHPDVYFETVDDEGYAKRGGHFEDDPDRY